MKLLECLIFPILSEENLNKNILYLKSCLFITLRIRISKDCASHACRYVDLFLLFILGDYI